ncbi:unnamed protein product, partial [Hapterophycus canaliculatus]
KEALDGLLEIEGLPTETPAEDYIAHMVRQTFLEPVEWQVSEIQSAFFNSLSPSSLRGKGSDGSSGAGESKEGAQEKRNRREAARDFDFREVFLVYEDQDLTACSPLREAFWSVVHSELSSEERRLLLLFITGTDCLPEAGCETLSIE